ncbi:MAG: amidohydrolase family protein [Cytophagaceae bacterium]|nr:amidohydrolase family protein [Gemmatimonadaceae bacterium]
MTPARANIIRPLFRQAGKGAPAFAFRPMKRVLALVALAVTPARAQAQAIAITHVQVVDVEAGRLIPDQTVIVQGRRIASVGPARQANVPHGARVVDGRGRYLIPGLWDMHAHTTMPGGRAILPLYVANGVTGLRDMAGDWNQLVAWRREIANGTLIGPRMIVSGPYIEGGDVPIPHLLARNPDEARVAVDSLIRLGVDFIKLHSQFTRETFLAAASRARARGIPFTGHVPRSVGAAEASDSGQRSLEHLLQIPFPCTPAESLAMAPRFQVQRVLARCSSTDLRPLWATLARNRTWVVPTLVAQYEVASWPRRTVPGDAYARYLPDSLRAYVAQIFPMPADVPPRADVTGLALFNRGVSLIGIMHRAGIAVMPGTDAPLRNSPPGFGLHAELEWFVRGGMTPAEALRSATLEPARYFNAVDSSGTIAAGKVADLVLLEANPLRDIRRTRRVYAVVANGRLMTAVERSAILRSMLRR